VIYEQPTSVYVADFIGDVNIIEGQGTKAGDGYDVAFAEGEPTLHAKTGKDLGAHAKCHLAIRPEKVRITTEKPRAAGNALEGSILDIAYLGNISTYHVQLSNGRIMKAQEANTTRLSRRAFTWEDKVWLSWSDTAAVVLEG
jgi:putrescine transport system ATP-binding protein